MWPCGTLPPLRVKVFVTASEEKSVVKFHAALLKGASNLSGTDLLKVCLCTNIRKRYRAHKLLAKLIY